jgi:lysophospholipase L1-like esterase
VNNIIPAINHVADNLDLPTVDMYHAMSNSEYFSDGIHPNENGATILADTLYGAVQQYYDPTDDPYT